MSTEPTPDPEKVLREFLRLKNWAENIQGLTQELGQAKARFDQIEGQYRMAILEAREQVQVLRGLGLTDDKIKSHLAPGLYDVLFTFNSESILKNMGLA